MNHHIDGWGNSKENWNPKPTMFLMVGYQLDDFISLHQKWLEINKHSF